MNNIIYNLLKSIITNKDYQGANASEKEDMNNKLDVFFAFDRLSLEQYQELHGLVNIIAE